MSEWQPIETAPKDVYFIGATEHGYIGLYCWEPQKFNKRPKPFWKEGWTQDGWSRAHQPTHWMPLPKPPPQTVIPDEMFPGENR